MTFFFLQRVLKLQKNVSSRLSTMLEYLWNTFLPPLPVASNMESSIEDQSPPPFQTSQDLAQITSQLSNESKMNFMFVGDFLIASSLLKPDSDDIITSAFQASDFLLEWMQQKPLRRWGASSLRGSLDDTAGESGWNEYANLCTAVGLRELSSRRHEKRQRTVAQVCFVPISFSPSLAARRLPSTHLTSISSHLYLCPLCASSNSPNFLSEAGV